MTLPTLRPRAALISPLPLSPDRLRAVIVIVAGVAGSGKTTVGTQLATRLGWRFADADSFHSAVNIAKMRAGIPLTDKDRAPWLRAITGWMDDIEAAGESGVITCSALRRRYRDELLSGRPAATMVFLLVSREDLIQRLSRRAGHFFPEKLLDSQLAAVEPPAPDERVLTLLEDGGPAHLVDEIVTRLGLDPQPTA
jgi:gluconokinase